MNWINYILEDEIWNEHDEPVHELEDWDQDSKDNIENHFLDHDYESQEQFKDHFWNVHDEPVQVPAPFEESNDWNVNVVIPKVSDHDLKYKDKVQKVPVNEEEGNSKQLCPSLKP